METASWTEAPGREKLLYNKVWMQGAQCLRTGYTHTHLLHVGTWLRSQNHECVPSGQRKWGDGAEPVPQHYVQSRLPGSSEKTERRRGWQSQAMPARFVQVLGARPSCLLSSKYKHPVPHQGACGLGSCADDTHTQSLSLIQLFLRQNVPTVRQLVYIAGAGRVVLILRAGLTRGMEELHEFSEAVRHLGGGLVS